MAGRSEFDETKTRRMRNAAIAAGTRALAGEIDGHPRYEDLAAVVDGKADDVTREIVESHAEVCPTCAAELADLRAFAGKPRRSIWWLAAAAALAAALMLGYVATRPGEHPAPTTVASSSSPDRWQRLAAEALRDGRVEVPADIRALAADDAYRGGENAAGARITVTPSATVIDDLHPQFRWSGLSADVDDVELYEEGEPFARSGPLRANAWTSARALTRGKSYRWQVVARRGKQSFIVPSPPAPPAVFRVLDAQAHDELSRATAKHSGDDLLLGVLYARAGMLDPARDHLQRYASKTQSPAARKLAASIDFSR